MMYYNSKGRHLYRQYAGIGDLSGAWVARWLGRLGRYLGTVRADSVEAKRDEKYPSSNYDR